MKELDNKEIKQVLLGILLHFHSFCEEHGLVYSLDSGTLLGAVRHKGFIPWDDDIDVIMPRQDYERLRELYPKQNEEKHYMLHDYRENGACAYPFLKLSDENTRMCVPGKDDVFPMGLFIDIFPLDGMPKDKGERERHVWRIRFMRKVSFMSALHTGIPGRHPMKAMLVRLFKLMPHGNNPGHWNAIIEKMALKYPLEESECAGSAMWNSFGALQLRADAFKERVKLEFEGHEVWVIKAYDYYLTVCYGDYMTPPPVEHQQGIHVAKCYSKYGE